MTKALILTLIGYICGNILFANIFSRFFHKNNILEQSKDQNPGTANAYLYGGFWCGTCTLCGDLLKGFIPVYLCTLSTPVSEMDWKYAFVLAAPVIGHTFPVFSRLRGGKGIATTFGCLLGLFPYTLPLFLFAAFFIFFSIVLRVTPHFYRTIFVYISTFLFLILLKAEMVVRIGFLIISATVCFRLHLSKEEREKVEVRLSWM